MLGRIGHTWLVDVFLGALLVRGAVSFFVYLLLPTFSLLTLLRELELGRI
jgi:hypothetical protein